MLSTLSRHPKLIAWSLVILFYLDLILVPVVAKGEKSYVRDESRRETGSWLSYLERQKSINVPAAPAIAEKKQAGDDHITSGGPTQPEMASFTSVNASNMVDLFSGDFSYNIPLMDVGGYPINLAYRGGISMDQEASWVGLGWNINPGTITRNMRGLPDDFDGSSDSVKKVMSIRPNETVGVTGGADLEIVGFPQNVKDRTKYDTARTGVTVGASLGVFHNNYRGWGIEWGLNASINAGTAAKGAFTGGLSLTNNSQEGLTISPSFSLRLQQEAARERGIGESLTIGLPYNSRGGLKALQISAGIRQSVTDATNQKEIRGYGESFSSSISFVHPTFTPSMSIPYTSRQFTLTGKLGLEYKVSHPNFFLSGYVSTQRIASDDTLLALPAYGYLHYSKGAQNMGALLDFNREKDMPYREKPEVPHIAIPSYTYDAFSITGEGTGGMFRAYRGDIGFVYDHYMRSKDESDRLGVDIGVGDLRHAGVNININRAFTETGPWWYNNPVKGTIDFREDSMSFESVYFKNPGEKSINSKTFYENTGGDDLVTVGLYQPDPNNLLIRSSNYLTRYRNKRAIGNIRLRDTTVVKRERDKRAQVITYITALEADGGAGLSKYIESYTMNQFSSVICGEPDFENLDGEGIGLAAAYYPKRNFGKTPFERIDAKPDFRLNVFQAPNIPHYPPDNANFPKDKFSIRWEGRLRAPVTGQYVLYLYSDDGTRLWLNDSLRFKNSYFDKPLAAEFTDTVNLVEGEVYTIKIDYYENKANAGIHLDWKYPGQAQQKIPHTYLYPPPAKDTFAINEYIVKEKRINKFRKANHISEINVLNTDGRRYVYGIPVYNLKQKEATFSVQHFNGDPVSGLVTYRHDTDNVAKNRNGRDWYYNSEVVPAYAHSFLLTGILSADYSDVTGNGISDDDIGDAVKFNYSKISGVSNPFKWRAPQAANKATYNEGLKTDSMDDRGSYVYGEKELWYLHTIESKTMIATFELENRHDLLSYDESGKIVRDGAAKRLKEINLYTKAEFMKKGPLARPIKTVHFDYGYQLCEDPDRTDTGKLTLQRVWFSYNGNNKGRLNPYVFSYNARNPDHEIKSYDRWGNYKDPLQNPGSSIGNLISNAEYPYALQDSITAAQNAAAWMLDSIHLPSGGSMKITYESDDYAYVQNKRAMQVFKIAGLGTSSGSTPKNELYHKDGNGNWDDNMYIFIKVPTAVSSAQDVYQKYLTDVKKLFFRLYVRMPDDQFGTGSEFISCYASLTKNGGYGMLNSNTIWVRIDGITLKGDEPGVYSPLAKAAIQYLRLNLPSKAMPGSENMGGLTLRALVEALAATASNITTAFKSFDRVARNKPWAVTLDTSRSFVRLNNPIYKKYGGGHRVKRIIIHDNWDSMTNQKAATYGQEYSYTTVQEINGVKTRISSGVANYEPLLGGEENPFRQPIDYIVSQSALGPTTLGYTEEPLGESFFPSAGVGYSCVRMRTIHYKNRKSANGYEETKFYTAYDFPVYVDRSVIDGDTKKRFRSPLADFLRINVRHHISLTQGFKIELNDMHGKLRSKATYPETDSVNYISYSENIYRVDNRAPAEPRLSNTVMAIHPNGNIDTAALIGKDVELMVDMRQQYSVTNGYNGQLNSELFTVPFTPGWWMLPSLYNFAQREENLFRSVATVKIIQRYGILDSVIAIDKGSKVSTKDILYDAETGDVVLTRTQNEFNDYVYNFTYPSHWAYDGMGLAYKNIDVTLKHIDIREGKIISGLNFPEKFFSSGDEIFVAGKQKTSAGNGCDEEYATFPNHQKIWAIDSSVLKEGQPSAFYFIDREGKPYSGFDVTLKIVRSGRRNIFGAVGSVTSLASPLRTKMGGGYELKLDDTSKAVAAGAASFKQFWKTDDIRRDKKTKQCVGIQPDECAGDTSCTCRCLRSLFDYLIASRRLFIKANQNITIDSLVTSADAAGYNLSMESCDLLSRNSGRLFQSLTDDSVSHVYKARIGDCVLSFFSQDTSAVNFYKLESEPCDTADYVNYFTNDTIARAQAVTDTFYASVNQVLFRLHFNQIRTNVPAIIAWNASDYGDFFYKYSSSDSVLVDGDDIHSIRTYINFDDIDDVGVNSEIISASLNLYAYPTGFNNGMFGAAVAHAVTDSLRIFVPNFEWDPFNIPPGPAVATTGYDDTILVASSSSQNYSFSAKTFVETWQNSPIKFTGLGFNAHTDDTTFFTFASNLFPASGLWPSLIVSWIPRDSVVTKTTRLKVEFCQSCSIVVSDSCHSIVTDTTFNPYVVGVLGNWRSDRSLVYYSRRTESDPTTATTDIRRFGTIKDFAPYWKFINNKLVTQNDTTRWVWNSEMTLFNRKGFEIENKDPLGRYNAVAYGYNQTLPTAVTQNSRYRESAFDGFEDYDFVTQLCDLACVTQRHFDFTNHISRIDTIQRHSGKASLKLQNDTIGLSFSLAPDSVDASAPSLNFSMLADTCAADGKVLESVSTDSKILIPLFKPVAGKQMVLSAWVKEEQDCKCISYANNRILLSFTGNATTYSFKPSGTIIEGWQRYESVFEIPSNATGVTVSLGASGSVNVYFDDLRIHPFNSNMKSFVFHPVNLRLMAELDENNYATFYEYDDDGTLIRLKKETERGIKMIRETRSALVKKKIY